MDNYHVTLGVHVGARNTSRRLVFNVPAENPLAAAITAERLGDCCVSESSDTVYTHALNVRKLGAGKRPACVMTPVAA